MGDKNLKKISCLLVMPMDGVGNDNKKPPIGIMPKSIWDEMRREELGNAITRYFNAGLPIPVEWIEEWNWRE